MENLNKFGVCAFGVKTGVILPGDDIVEVVYQSVKDIVGNNDIVCITEAVVAMAQKNYVTTDEIAQEIRKKLKVTKNDSVGVIYPITSRNRFSLILKGIARAVERGKVIIQLSFPSDEVGNLTIRESFLKKIGKELNDKISLKELNGRGFLHPFTNIDYISFYNKIVSDVGAESEIFLSNNPKEIISHNPKGIIISSIHSRNKIKKEIEKIHKNCLTLQEICNDRNKKTWSEWGLLGSNMADDRLKLAPRETDKIVKSVQVKLKNIGKKVEVIVYGDGAYKDPDSGIYELADPSPFLALTRGLERGMRRGIKYKLFVEKLHKEKKNKLEIEKIIERKKKESCCENSISSEGTTPRKLAYIVASLADLVSGSADAGTPVVVVKNLL